MDLVFIGAGERIRTSDLLITNQLLCQLSYTGARGVRIVEGWFALNRKTKLSLKTGGYAPE